VAKLLDNVDNECDDDDDDVDVIEIIKQDIEVDDKKDPDIDNKLSDIVKGPLDKTPQRGEIETQIREIYSLKQKCNSEIWSIRLNESQRSNDLKGTVAVTTLADKLLKLH